MKITTTLAALALLASAHAMAEQTPDNLGWNSDGNIISATKAAFAVYHSQGFDAAKQNVEDCYESVTVGLTRASERCMAMDVATLYMELNDVNQGDMMPDPYFSVASFRARAMPYFAQWGNGGNNKFRQDYTAILSNDVQAGLMAAVSPE